MCWSSRLFIRVVSLLVCYNIVATAALGYLPPHSFGQYVRPVCTKVVDPSNPLTLYFETCHGMFNQYQSLAAALWLVSRLVSEAKFARPLHFKIPYVLRSFGGHQKALFSSLYDFDFTKTQLQRYNISASEQRLNERCPYKLVLALAPSSKASRSRNPRFIHSKLQLRRTLHDLVGIMNASLTWIIQPCVTIYPAVRKDIKACFLYVPYTTGQLNYMFAVGYAFLRFKQVLLQYIQNISRQLNPYTSIHLRVERDAPRCYQRAIRFPCWDGFLLNYSMLEPCLVSHYPDLYKHPLYIATSNSVFRYPQFKIWRQQTALRILTKKDVFHSNLRLGREEWALLEALILLQSHMFLGYSFSSFSGFVVFTRQQMGKRSNQQPNNGNITSSFPSEYWDLHCPEEMFGRLPKTSTTAEEELHSLSLDSNQ